KNAQFSLMDGENIDQFIARVSPYIFDPKIAPKKVVQDDGVDLVKSSAVNFYEGVTQKEVEAYYAKLRDPKDSKPISLGLNSKVVKKDGKVSEMVYSENGLYGEAITKIIYWLNKAAGVAENQQQKEHIEKLIEYYKTGDLRTWDAYNVLWVKDVASHIDFVNGFIETYDDPMGMKATWEAVVNFKDIEATKRTEIISNNAQWFEDHSPVDTKFKKKEVKGVTAKVITVAQLGGACYPTTPIGINLPNANWIRKDHGSKSVTMENITYAYDQAALGGGVLEEFCSSEAEIELSKKHGALADNLHTDMHECLGHGSGQVLPGISDDALKNYSSVLEECRADLFALYFMMDNKMVELGLMESLDVAKAAYDKYIRNGLMMQLTRIELGKNIEQAHMRNRAIISRWCYEKGKEENVIEKLTKDGKTYFVINDYIKLQKLFGELLSEVQRMKSTGDFKAGKQLVENYGIKIDYDFHKEILDRYSKLKVAPYGGFMNPQFVPVEKDGKIVDIKVEYPDNYTKQMLDYSKKYSFLPIRNL
ncbi:MAG: dihydrofolate reductase, partial [Bacteroidales bacterium]|nr:dihydrofolate reductase [Bacteroidales bacterium]